MQAAQFRDLRKRSLAPLGMTLWPNGVRRADHSPLTTRTSLFFPPMPDAVLRIVNARQNNLRGITVDLPRRALIAVTGPSGSGKSSLAFDTLYAEGQRR